MAYDFAALNAPNPTGYNDGQPLWAQLAALGTNLTQSILQYKTSENQINHGQVPSTAIGPNGLITAQNAAQQTVAANTGTGINLGNGASISGGLLLLIGGFVLLIVLLKR